MVEFNKMFVMVPLMLASRYIDGEDPKVILLLRIAYFSVQSLIVLFSIYTYIQATAAAQGKDNKVIYVPSPPQVRQVPRYIHYSASLLVHSDAECFGYVHLHHRNCISSSCMTFENSPLPIPMHRKSIRKLRLERTFSVKRVV